MNLLRISFEVAARRGRPQAMLFERYNTDYFRTSKLLFEGFIDGLISG